MKFVFTLSLPGRDAFNQECLALVAATPPALRSQMLAVGGVIEFLSDHSHAGPCLLAADDPRSAPDSEQVPT